jgi:chemotaxis protein methyltransferase CheR
MERENESNSLIITVASSMERARQLTSFLEKSGFAARPSRDLADALDENPALLVIDPTGWESTCRAILEDVERRAYAPPAVFFAGGGESALFDAGPALGLITEKESLREAKEKIRIALAGRKFFTSSWPRLASAFKDYDITRVEKILTLHTGVSVRIDRLESLRREFFLRGVANLSDNPQELESMLGSPGGATDLAILTSRVVAGETYFWRYSGQMQSLKGVLRRRYEENPGQTLKIWCAGCSTGEEVYSAVLAAFEELGEDINLIVWGTDINAAALARAKEACYTDRSVRNLPERFLENWFKKESHCWRVAPELRDRVRFEKLNLCGQAAREWAFANGPFDAVFCRNVIIYLDPVNSRDVNKLCLDSIAEGGGYFLGSSEMLVPIPENVDVVHEAGAFFYHKGKEAAPPPAAEEPAVECSNGEELENLYRNGIRALGREDFAEAERAFRAVIEISPEDSRGNTGIAILLTNQGREVEATQKLQKALAVECPIAEAYFLQGLLDERAGRDNEALGMYGSAINRDANFFMAHVNRAWILKRRGRMGAFRKEMQSALEVLRRMPGGASWTTGGLGSEAILKMVADALGDNAADR